MTAKAKAKPKPAWKPVPVAVQVARHRKAVVAAKKAAAQPASVKKARHITAVKAVATRKAAKHGLALSPDDVPCCVAQAVAESLRLALGVRLSDEDVLGLHWAAGGDRDAGASIVDVLEAAQGMGLAGRVPRYSEAAQPLDAGIAVAGECTTALNGAAPCCLILGLDLPEGPHAVLEHAGVWWSWGEAYEPWDAPVTEARAVSW